jgi:hypothetical protein
MSACPSCNLPAPAPTWALFATPAWNAPLHTFLHATAVLRRLLARPQGPGSCVGLLEEKRCTAPHRTRA